MPISKSQFTFALLGEGEHDVRYAIAKAFEDRARERRDEGRPDIAGRLVWAEGRITSGQFVTKRVKDKLRQDIAIIEARLCR